MSAVVGYIRVSTAEQVAGFGLDMQEDAIRAYCAGQGDELAAVHRDEAKSGSNGIDSRRGLADALATIEAGEAGALVVWKLDRLARDLIVQETVIARVEAAGGRVVSVTEPEGEGDEATRVLVRQVLGAIAQYERAVIRSRMEAGRARAVSEGRRGQGGSPYGWKAIHGQLVPVEAEQATIRRMQEWTAAGCSASEVARRLNADGVPAQRGTWHPSTVARVLRREAGRS